MKKIWFTLPAPILILLCGYWGWYQLESKMDLSSTSTRAVYQKTPATLFLSACDCDLPFLEPHVVAYEDEVICPKDRRYFEPALKKMPSWVKEVRDPFPEANFGRECVALIQKSFMSSAQSSNSKYFATCANSNSAPVRGAKQHCVSQDYVNSVYNALVDVADCLNLPQKDLIAKLSNESGLHLNTYGANKDAGIGQLTGDAIGAVVGKYWNEGGRITVRDYYLAEVGRSSKASCQRIISYPAAYDKITESTDKRCNLLNAPENPYRNLLYTGIFHRTILHYVAGIRFINGKDYVETRSGGNIGLQEVLPDQTFEPRGKIAELQIKKNMQALGIKNPDAHAITRALVMLGYNAGPGKAAEYFNVYFKKRLQEKRWLKPTDVDFLNTDFIKTWQKMVGGMAKVDAKASAALKEARKTAHARPLPEFLLLIQDSGSPGYLSKIALKHKELIKQMGDNRCVSPNFVHF